MRKRSLFIFLLFILLVAISYLTWLFPVVIDNYKYSDNCTSDFVVSKGDTIKPLDEIDNLKDIEIYIITHMDDKDELPNEIKHKIIYTGNPMLVARMKECFKFIYSGGDVATCESFIYIRQGGKIVFKSAIAINDDCIGLQDKRYGWIEVADHQSVLDMFKNFDPIYRPIVWF